MKKPNILLVYPDEMRFDVTGASGNTVCKTPAIDKMAAEGAFFENAYTSFPLCCPFRGSLMTGKYAHKNGMFANHIPIPLGQQYIPEMVKEAGYRTAWVGKWHLNGGKKFMEVPKEYQLGFDEFTGYSRGHHYIDCVYYFGDDPQAYTTDKYEPEIQTDQIIDFMSRSVDDDVPFMGMICYGLPHHPVEMAPDHYKHMYKPEDLELPDTIPPWLQEESAEYRAMYYGMVTCVDDQMKRINDFLEAKGIKDDTMLILVSDHGDMCHEFGYTDKYVCHDGSAHVPFLVQYPNGIDKNFRPDQIVDPAVTIVPTILDACGVEVPDYMPGKSLMPLLTKGSDETLDDFAYYQVLEVTEDMKAVEERREENRYYPERGFRTKDVLYVEKCGVPFKMYDLKKDPEEKYNVVDNAYYIFDVKKNQERLKEIMDSVDDNWTDYILDQVPADYQSHKEAEGAYGEIVKTAIMDNKVYQS